MTPGLIRPIPAIPQPGTLAAMIAVENSQLKYHEGHNASGWNNDTIFGKWYGMNRSAWCAIYQIWCAHYAGCSKIIPHFAYTPTGRDWFVGRNQFHHTPKPGDLGFLWSSSMGRIHHVFFVENVLPDGSFHTVEGNTNNTGSAQGDGVYRLHRNSTGGGEGGFGRPKYRAAS